MQVLQISDVYIRDERERERERKKDTKNDGVAVILRTYMSRL